MPRLTLRTSLVVALAIASSALVSAARAAEPATMVLSLQQAVDLSLLSNLALQGARIDVQVAQAQVAGSRGPFDPVLFGYYQHRKDVEPQVSAVEATFTNGLFDIYSTGVRQKLYYGASYDVSFSTTRTKRGVGIGISPAYQANVSFKYTQPLLRGLGRDANRNLILQAINSASISRKEFEATARDVARDTVLAYWDLVFAIEDLRVRRASLSLAEELLRKNRIMVEVGTLAPLEITQAEASVAQRNFEIISAEALVGAAEDNLRRLMGVEEGAASWDVRLVPADEPEFQASFVDPAETLAKALSSRSELAAADLGKENAQLSVKAARDSRLPQLDLVLALEPAGLAGDVYGIDTDPLVDADGDGDPTNDQPLLVHSDVEQAWDQVSSWDFTSWSAALSYTQPLPNRAAKADYLSKRLTLERRDIEIRQLRQSIALEVRKSLRDLDSARERIGAAGAARTLQQKTLHAEVKKFENGLSTNFEILQFQTDLQNAESAELRSLTDYLRALAEVKRNRGTLLEDYGLQLAE